ncbi:hypothetical protein COO60DRAFT_1039678 [Scenedesmus sp. NREL 46B-D3]|nr:hypothetical protein COO60DRAFT_1039678 [Scenedesmus sp. NREL 46B-D3]
MLRNQQQYVLQVLRLVASKSKYIKTEWHTAACAARNTEVVVVVILWLSCWQLPLVPMSPLVYTRCRQVTSDTCLSLLKLVYCVTPMRASIPCCEGSAHLSCLSPPGCCCTDHTQAKQRLAQFCKLSILDQQLPCGQHEGEARLVGDVCTDGSTCTSQTKRMRRAARCCPVRSMVHGVTPDC